MTHFAFFCDDVRQEINGKYIFVGCYGDSIVVQQFPYEGQLCAVVYTDRNVVSGPVSIKFQLSSGAVLADGQVRLEAQEDGDLPSIAQLPLPPMRLSLSSADELQLWFGASGEAPELLASVKILQGQVPQIGNRVG